MTNVKQVIIILAVFIMLGICVSSAAAGTYSITQTSKYTYSTDNTPLDPLGMHRDISDWADPDITDLKNHMNAAKWKLNRHYTSNESTMEAFKNEIDKSDIHFHAGHGLNIPFIVGGHMELKDHPLPKNAVNANDMKGHLNHCKWLLIHACYVLEDTNWANVLKGSKSHGILGFGSTTYTSGHFLSDYGEKITNGWTLAKAWEKTSYDQFNDLKDNVTVRTFFKNFDQYLHDKLNTPSTNTTEDIVMCDTAVNVEDEKHLITNCTCMKSGTEYKIENKNVSKKVIVEKNANG